MDLSLSNTLASATGSTPERSQSADGSSTEERTEGSTSQTSPSPQEDKPVPAHTQWPLFPYANPGAPTARYWPQPYNLQSKIKLNSPSPAQRGFLPDDMKKEAAGVDNHVFSQWQSKRDDEPGLSLSAPVTSGENVFSGLTGTSDDERMKRLESMEPGSSGADRMVSKWDIKREEEQECYDPETNRYNCSQCTASFTMLGNLRRHKKCHDPVRPFNCPHCTKGFLRKQSYIEHIRLHTGEKPFVCHLCGASFTRRKCYQVHQKSCIGIPPRSNFSQGDAGQEDEGRRSAPSGITSSGSLPGTPASESQDHSTGSEPKKRRVDHMFGGSESESGLLVPRASQGRRGSAPYTTLMSFQDSMRQSNDMFPGFYPRVLPTPEDLLQFQQQDLLALNRKHLNTKTSPKQPISPAQRAHSAEEDLKRIGRTNFPINPRKTQPPPKLTVSLSESADPGVSLSADVRVTTPLSSTSSSREVRATPPPSSAGSSASTLRQSIGDQSEATASQSAALSNGAAAAASTVSSVEVPSSDTAAAKTSKQQVKGQLTLDTAPSSEVSQEARSINTEVNQEGVDPPSVRSRGSCSSPVLLGDVEKEKKLYHCMHCDIFFGNKTTFLLHRGLHGESDPLRCSLCRQSFSSTNDFLVHH